MTNNRTDLGDSAIPVAGSHERISHRGSRGVGRILLVAGMAALNLVIGCSSRPVRYTHRWELVNPEGEVVDSAELTTSSETVPYSPFEFDPVIVQGIFSGIYRVIYTLIPDYGLGLFAYFGTVLDPNYQAEETARQRAEDERRQQQRQNDAVTEPRGDEGTIHADLDPRIFLHHPRLVGNP